MKALEAAEAARRKEAVRAAERARQRAALEQQRADRLKRAGDARVPRRVLPLDPYCHSLYPGTQDGAEHPHFSKAWLDK